MRWWASWKALMVLPILRSEDLLILFLLTCLLLGLALTELAGVRLAGLR